MYSTHNLVIFPLRKYISEHYDFILCVNMVQLAGLNGKGGLLSDSWADLIQSSKRDKVRSMKEWVVRGDVPQTKGSHSKLGAVL